MRLLIAESSEVITAALMQALGSEFEICACCDGCEALEQLQRFQPYALILNLHLPRRDGFTVLRQSAWQPPVIVAITHQSGGSYVPRTATEMGISKLLIMPTVSCVAASLMELLSQEIPERNNRDRIATVLQDLSFRSHLDGYRQLLVGIRLFAEDPRQSLGRSLYPAIAGQLGHTSGQTVEKSIRKTIEDAWNNRDESVWRKYFAADANGRVPCPNNKLFLARMAELLGEKQKVFL